MSMYEKVFSVLQEKVSNGELAMDDAEALNDLAYERYADSQYQDTNETITLEDAMNYIDDALQDASDREVVARVQESVDEMRLRVYDAYRTGLITESERDDYLEYLNLENYE